MNYQVTPHLTRKYAPTQLLFNRETCTKLPSQVHKNVSELDKKVRENDKNAKQRMKENSDRRSRAQEKIVETGDLVLVRHKRKNKFLTKFDPRPYRVVRVKGTMITACRDGHNVMRITSFYKKLPGQDDVQIDNGFENDEINEEDRGEHRDEQIQDAARYPQMKRRYVERYGQNIYDK